MSQSILYSCKVHVGMLVMLERNRHPVGAKLEWGVGVGVGLVRPLEIWRFTTKKATSYVGFSLRTCSNSRSQAGLP